jgi:hypothetical protein
MRRKNTLSTLVLSTLLLSSAAFANSDITFVDNFSDPSLSNWNASTKYSATDGKLSNDSWGSPAIIDVEKFKVDSHYTVSMIIDPSPSKHSQPLIFGFKDYNSAFYTAQVKMGQWGGLYLGKFTDISSNGEKLFSLIDIPIDETIAHELKVNVEGDDVRFYFDGLLIHTMVMMNENELDHDGNQVGIRALYNDDTIKLDDFTVRNSQTFYTDFPETAGGLPSSFDHTGIWGTSTKTNLLNIEPGYLITNDNFLAKGTYSAELTWENESTTALNSPSLIVSYTDESTPFYTVVVENGADSTVRLYQHASIEDATGTLMVSKVVYNTDNGKNTIEARMWGNDINIHVNGVSQLSYTDIDGISGNRAGIRYLEASESVFTRSFQMTK